LVRYRTLNNQSGCNYTFCLAEDNKIFFIPAFPDLLPRRHPPSLKLRRTGSGTKEYGHREHRGRI